MVNNWEFLWEHCQQNRYVMNHKLVKKKTAMEWIWFDSIPDADKRKSVIQALRLEITRKTTTFFPEKEELEFSYKF